MFIFSVGIEIFERHPKRGIGFHWWCQPNINVLMLPEAIEQLINFMLHFMVTLFKICSVLLAPLTASGVMPPMTLNF